MNSVIGIDIGTGSTKAVVVQAPGAVTAHARRSYATAHNAAGYSEQNPHEVWAAFLACLGEVLLSTTGSDTTACLSSAMHGLICVDASGLPLSPLLLWSDTRSAAVAAHLMGAPEGKICYTATGTPIHAMSPLCKIRWLKENQPVLFAQTAKFISIKEYIWWKLFGVYEIDHSIASATGLFDIERCTWFAPALQWAGISAEQLSLPVPVNHTRKWIGQEEALTIARLGPCVFMIGASDGCLASVATFATEPGVAALTVGTSGAVRMASPVPFRHFPSMPFCYLLEEGSYICGGAINNGGAVLQWVLQNFSGIEEAGVNDYTALFNEIDAVPCGSEGLLFLPYLAGERAPVWDAKSCGVFFGITRRHGRAHMMRAAIEGVCFALNDVVQMLERMGGTINVLRVSGGFTASPAWMQMIADVTGKSVELVQTWDASALGAAYFTLKKANIQVECPEAASVFHPQVEKERVYKQQFGIYRRLYPALANVMHDRYDLNH